MGRPRRKTSTAAEGIRIVGARQHNLKGVDVEIPLGAITVVTGVSGAGKSSLAFDTLYAEGQRRYVESFSPYARQFMERIDRPDVAAVEGVLPAVAIDQKNTIRASRSTVATVTELADYIKLLYAGAAVLHCESCGEPVVSEEPDAVAAALLAEHDGRWATVTAPLPRKGRAAAVEQLQQRGYRRYWQDGARVADEELARATRRRRPLAVLVDRVRLASGKRSRLAESVEAAMDLADGVAEVHIERPGGGRGRPLENLVFSRGRRCARCGLSYPAPLPSHFSYNSPLGACSSCNGFGALIGVDFDLVVPDPRLSLAEGAIRPWSTEGTRHERAEMLSYCARVGIPTDAPWRDLSCAQRRRLREGDRDHRWYGIEGWFRYLERRSYKMHVRVLLSRYRAYGPCPSCHGARLAPGALRYRLDGLTLPQLYALDIDRARGFFEALQLPVDSQRALAPVVSAVRSRLRYLCQAGVGYLTLDRQSRTLSGGEVQRVNLTTAIGSALVNTLYVLDEPSVGLHPRDNERLMRILERLRANRNTIVLVEHDEAVIRRCDHVIDIGPGPGSAGGQVVFSGSPARLRRATRRSATARSLFAAGRRRPPAARRANVEERRRLTVHGARQHNLRGIDVAFPRGALTVVTGVSGSGKSTLVVDVLYRGLMRRRGRPVDRPGAHDAISGDDGLAEIVLVDQSPVGSTTRSNAATYVKVFDAIRRLFAAQPRAQLLGFGPGTFSFNVPGGRCDACEGNGHERVEMQFLADCFVVCERCSGRRYKEEVLSVRVEGRSIADVLRLTVDDAVAAFAELPEVGRRLGALQRVGLGYLELGQPLNTLSGGESQRLKLAGSFSGEGEGEVLYLLDEPTTGLHADDVRLLLSNLRQLVEGGSTVVVIEHHLELIAGADWIVDLGPEGGPAGGAVVAAGVPGQVAATDGHTGCFLAAFLGRSGAAGRASEPRREHRRDERAPAEIVVRGARVHNLQRVDLQIPRDQLVVVTGPSGSGKSSLAFDVLFAEGQRRFIDCLSPYARQYVAQVARPELDELLGVPPTVCITQLTARAGRRSTVATMTEIYHYLRLVFARVGVRHCPRCGGRAAGLAAADLVATIREQHAGQSVRLLAPAVRARKGYHDDVFERARAGGLEEVRVDGRLVPLEQLPRRSLDRYRAHDVELVVARLRIDGAGDAELTGHVERALGLGDGTVYVLRDRRRSVRKYSRDLYCGRCGVGFDPPDPQSFSFNSPAGACVECDGTGVAPARDGRDDRGSAFERPCPTCEGTRLTDLSRAVRFGGRSIDVLAAMTPGELAGWAERLELGARERTIAGPALREIAERCRFLERVGLEYLSLARGAHTLSGGEAQRVRLAAQLSANLRGVLYVLDEPTVGLHQLDNRRVLDALRSLVEGGNTVLVVEHDDETIRSADYLVDMGPGGGTEGGEVVAAGPAAAVLTDDRSLTARCLARPGEERALHRGRPPAEAALRVLGARHHNLRDLDCEIPLGRLTVVTGVSGSGKSSLVRDVLGEGLRRRHRGEGPRAPGLCRTIDGGERVERVREIDQSPIGKTPASTPATYVGLFDHVRKLFASVPEARVRGYGPGRFSYNVRAGRCAACGGQGQVKHEMAFLPQVTVRCEVCGGRRYDEETLRVRYRGRSIAGVLDATVAEARELFEAVPAVRRSLDLLGEVGLDYLRLGQPSNTLSGGEAQRVKLVEELQKSGGQRALYIMDEPSTGLHIDDLQRLLVVLQRLVDRGDTVVVIEHNLDLIASADWIVDLGPGGGDAGGRLVYQGDRDGLLRARRSATGRHLRRFLNR